MTFIDGAKITKRDNGAGWCANRYDTIRYDTVEVNVRTKADGMASLI